MFEIKKRVEISAAHRLCLDYESKCTVLHGHNWIVDIYLRADKVKKLVVEPLDHKVLNDVLPFNPTAELLAEYFCNLLQPYCYRVDVQESINNVASYIK